MGSGCDAPHAHHGTAGLYHGASGQCVACHAYPWSATCHGMPHRSLPARCPAHADANTPPAIYNIQVGLLWVKFGSKFGSKNSSRLGTAPSAKLSCPCTAIQLMQSRAHRRPRLVASWLLVAACQRAPFSCPPRACPPSLRPQLQLLEVQANSSPTNYSAMGRSPGFFQASMQGLTGVLAARHETRDCGVRTPRHTCTCDAQC